MKGEGDSIQINLSEAQHFETVYKQYFAALKHFALQYISDAAVVCDLLQDLFVRIWEKGEVFENELALKAYLYRSVRNNCLTYHRNLQRKENQMAGYERQESEEAFINRIIEAEVYALINEVFEELPPATRLVYLKSLENKSHKEIARELNITINTIKKHKNNANHYLRARLEKLLAFLVYLS